MARVLITGMSGTGKSTILGELGRRGHPVLDTDHGGWVLPDGRWDEQRMWAFLEAQDTVVVSGTVDNQGEFYPVFRHVVLLSAPLPVLLERLRTRRGNPYGKTVQQREEVGHHLHEVEPLLRAGATSELDACLPVATLTDAIEALLFDDD